MRISRLPRRSRGGGKTASNPLNQNDSYFSAHPVTSARRLPANCAAQTAFHAALARAKWITRGSTCCWNFLRRRSRSLSSTPPATPASRTWTPANAKADTLAGNTLLPQTIAHACAAAGIPWGHVSSGCIYSGAKVPGTDRRASEKDMTRPELRALVEEIAGAIHGFTETDTPNFSFRDGRAVFTAAPRRWARRPWPASARATSGGCGFRSTNLTARAII